MNSSFANTKQLLAHYSQSWLLSEVVKIGESLSSHVYKVRYGNEPAFLKVFTDTGREDEKYGAQALNWFGGRGAVMLLKEDPGALLLEYLDGPDLKSIVNQGRDSEATAIIADTLDSLHKHGQNTQRDFPSLRSRFRCLFDNANKNTPEVFSSLFKEAAYVAEILLAEPRDEVVLHGDIHHENILYSNTRGWLAVDPKGIYGERTYDTSNALFNPTLDIVLLKERLFSTAEILASRLNCGIERLLAFAFVHGCLSVCWSIEDGQDPTDTLAVVSLIRGHLLNAGQGVMLGG